MKWYFDVITLSMCFSKTIDWISEESKVCLECCRLSKSITIPAPPAKCTLIHLIVAQFVPLTLYNDMPIHRNKWLSHKIPTRGNETLYRIIPPPLSLSLIDRNQPQRPQTKREHVVVGRYIVKMIRNWCLFPPFPSPHRSRSGTSGGAGEEEIMPFVLGSEVDWPAINNKPRVSLYRRIGREEKFINYIIAIECKCRFCCPSWCGMAKRMHLLPRPIDFANWIPIGLCTNAWNWRLGSVG